VARFKMLNPGVFIYHCAAPPVTWHIANGMYGMIIVEPKKGLPKADKEFCVFQSDVYTKKPFGAEGLQEFDDHAAELERPTYVVFNGAADSMTENPLKAKVGDKVRVWFGNGGPNLISSFHIIGVIFETLYNQGSFENPLSNVQTTLVPAGGACAMEFSLKVPGKYTLVDHSIFRVQKGAMGLLEAEGPEAPEIYKAIQ
jgi:nitrite reductase (NO-forming)